MKDSLARQFDLSGRVAIITGAANILGPQFAAALAEFGANLVLADIDQERNDRTAAEIRETFAVNALSVPTDVGDEAAVVRLVECAMNEMGRVDILLNGAATKTENYFKPFPEYSLADWNRVLSVNLTAMFLTCREVVPHFMSQKSGTIINIASIYGVVGPDPRIYEGSRYLGQAINTPAIYSASKGGVVNYTRYLATTLAEHGIRANTITPGGVESGQNQTFVDRYSARIPLARMARREELRGAALFLASDASSYVTGQNLIVDGGLTAW